MCGDGGFHACGACTTGGGAWRGLGAHILHVPRAGLLRYKQDAGWQQLSATHWQPAATHAAFTLVRQPTMQAGVSADSVRRHHRYCVPLGAPGCLWSSVQQSRAGCNMRSGAWGVSCCSCQGLLQARVPWGVVPVGVGGCCRQPVTGLLRLGHGSGAANRCLQVTHVGTFCCVGCLKAGLLRAQMPWNKGTQR